MFNIILDTRTFDSLALAKKGQHQIPMVIAGRTYSSSRGRYPYNMAAGGGISAEFSILRNHERAHTEVICHSA